MTDISKSEKLDGIAIVLKGLDAAKQQFQLHSRKNVPRVLLLVTNGINRLIIMLFTSQSYFINRDHLLTAIAFIISDLVGFIDCLDKNLFIRDEVGIEVWAHS